MPLYLPSFDEIMAVAETRGDASDAPHLWRGLVGAWPLQEPGGVTAYDVSGRAQHGTATGTAIPARGISTIGRMADFDAVNDTFITTFTMSLKDLTVLCWFRSTYAKAENPRLVDKSYQTGFYLGQMSNIDNTQWGGGIQYGSSPYGQTITLAAGVWHQLGIYRRGDQHVVFGDGGKVTNTRTGPTTATGTTAMRIGGGGISACDADIALVEVYSRALADAEIKEKYADPWAMYRLRTVVHPAAVAEEPSGFKPYWARPSYQIIGGGIA